MKRNNSLTFSLFMVVVCLSCLSKVVFAQIMIEDELFGVKLGSEVAVLDKKYPDLYKEQLVLGEILHEACNQESLEVFTFVEDPWSLGFVTHIDAKKEKNISVCRDETGALPDFNIQPITVKGIKLGDDEKDVLAKYGEPTEVDVKKDIKVLRYKINLSAKDMLVEKGMLVFVIEKSKVTSFSLFGFMPGGEHLQEMYNQKLQSKLKKF